MKYIKIVLLVMVLTSSAYSQNTLIGFSWSMGFTTGKTTDFVGAPSFTGFSFESHKFFKPNVSFGITTGWNILSEKNSDLIHLSSGTDISGAQGRYINVFPVLLNASYYIKSSRNAKFVPFLRAHAGTYYIMQRFDIGAYTLNNYNWHFGVAPEVGFMYKVGREMNILANARYNYAFDSGTRLGGDDKNDYAFFSVNLGIAYTY
jgi:hypothetical protein